MNNNLGHEVPFVGKRILEWYHWEQPQGMIKEPILIE